MKRQTPAGHCWVLGDNQKNSGDSSNNLGAVPLKNIVSKLIVRAGPEGWNWVEHGIDCIPKPVSAATSPPPPVTLYTDQKSIATEPMMANSTKSPKHSRALRMYQRPESNARQGYEKTAARR